MTNLQGLWLFTANAQQAQPIDANSEPLSRQAEFVLSEIPDGDKKADPTGVEVLASFIFPLAQPLQPAPAGSLPEVGLNPELTAPAKEGPDSAVEVAVSAEQPASRANAFEALFGQSVPLLGNERAKPEVAAAKDIKTSDLPHDPELFFAKPAQSLGPTVPLAAKVESAEQSALTTLQPGQLSAPRTVTAQMALPQPLVERSGLPPEIAPALSSLPGKRPPTVQSGAEAVDRLAATTKARAALPTEAISLQTAKSEATSPKPASLPFFTGSELEVASASASVSPKGAENQTLSAPPVTVSADGQALVDKGNPPYAVPAPDQKVVSRDLPRQTVALEAARIQLARPVVLTTAEKEPVPVLNAPGAKLEKPLEPAYSVTLTVKEPVAPSSAVIAVPSIPIPAKGETERSARPSIAPSASTGPTIQGAAMNAGQPAVPLESAPDLTVAAKSPPPPASTMLAMPIGAADSGTHSFMVEAAGASAASSAVAALAMAVELTTSTLQAGTDAIALSPTVDRPSLHRPHPGQQAGPETTVKSAPTQVAEAILAKSGQTFELRLFPEELGSVRIDIRKEADTVIVSVSAERQDTLDLLRRHADQLAADLRNAGQSGVSLSFGRWSDQDTPKEMGDRAAGNPDTSAGEMADGLPTNVRPHIPTWASGSGLYLRI